MSDFLFMSIVMPALTVTISKIAAVKIVHDHDLHLSNGVKSRYINRKPIYDSLCYGNCHACHLKLFAAKICMTLTMTFRMGQGQM